MFSSWAKRKPCVASHSEFWENAFWGLFCGKFCSRLLNFKALKALKFRHFAKQKRGLGFVLLQNKNPNGFSRCAAKQIPSVAKAKIRLLLLKFKHGVDNVCYTKCHDSPQHPAQAIVIKGHSLLYKLHKASGQNLFAVYGGDRA